MRHLDGVRMNPNGPVILHLFFADDKLIFLKADMKNCNNLVHLLGEYCSESKQEVNLQKSSVFFDANIPSDDSVEMRDILGMPTTSDPNAYLGVPTIWVVQKDRGWPM